MTNPNEMELWNQLPGNALLPSKEMAKCPHLGGSGSKPLHPVTMSRMRKEGRGPPYRVMPNGRPIYVWRDVLRWWNRLPVQRSTTRDVA